MSKHCWYIVNILCVIYVHNAFSSILCCVISSFSISSIKNKTLPDWYFCWSDMNWHLFSRSYVQFLDQLILISSEDDTRTLGGGDLLHKYWCLTHWFEHWTRLHSHYVLVMMLVHSCMSLPRVSFNANVCGNGQLRYLAVSSEIYSRILNVFMLMRSSGAREI
jgi:hypothetical protein